MLNTGGEVRAGKGKQGRGVLDGETRKRVSRGGIIWGRGGDELWSNGMASRGIKGSGGGKVWEGRFEQLIAVSTRKICGGWEMRKWRKERKNKSGNKKEKIKKEMKPAVHWRY